MTSSWFFLSTLNYDARSTTHQIYRIRDLTAANAMKETNQQHCVWMPFGIQVLLLSSNQVTTDDCEYYITTLDLVFAERASEMRLRDPIEDEILRPPNA